MEMTIIYAI